MQKVITKKKNYQIIEIKGILSILMWEYRKFAVLAYPSPSAPSNK